MMSKAAPPNGSEASPFHNVYISPPLSRHELFLLIILNRSLPSFLHKATKILDTHLFSSKSFTFSGLTSADISLQVFSDGTCGTSGGTVLAKVHADGSNTVDSSGCQALGKFGSVNVVSVDPGFQCNVYSDAACANFISSFDSILCGGVIGEGVTCFNQDAFDNPFVDSTAEPTVGANMISLLDDPSSFLTDAVNTACGTSGCDPTSQVTRDATFQSDPNCQPLVAPCDQTTCTVSATMTGNYDNTDQRDYMTSLLQQIFAKSFVPVSFGQVVINDRNGNNQAELEYTYSITCTDQSTSFDCGGFVGTLTSTVLGLVPAVGGLLAGAFSVTCEAFSPS